MQASPDDTRILFTKDKRGDGDLYERPAENSGAERQVYEALPGRGAASVDEIAVASGLAPEQVLVSERRRY